MKILQITLQHQRDNRWPVSATFDSSDGLPFRREGEMSLGENWETELRGLTLSPAQYGEYLGKALFREGILIICKQAENSIQPTGDANDDDHVHLFLNIEEPQMQTLRWERLAFPDDDGTWVSLAQHQRLVFSYYFPSLVSRQYPTLNKHKLAALVFVASPPEEINGYKPFDVSDTIATLRKSFGDIPVKVMADPKQATWAALRDELNKQYYPILHIVAHGFYQTIDDGDKRKDESYLILLNDAQQPEAVSASTLINQLKRMKGQLPSLIFLSSCETATPDASQGAHDHLARRLLDRLGTPAIIAMSDKVQIGTAGLLSENFYAYLRNDAHVDSALATAGMAIINRTDRHLPVLYHRLGHRPLFTQETKPLEQLTETEISHGLVLLAGDAGTAGLITERAPILREEFDALVRRLDIAHPNPELLKALDDLSKDTTEIGFAALAQDVPVSDYKTQTCPFPGMRPFKQEKEGEGTDYRPFFFGRSAKVIELLNRLEQVDVLLIKGSSGSGKSSIVDAGMLPKLKKRYQEEGKTLQITTMTPHCIDDAEGSQLLPHEQLLGKIKELDTEQSAILFIDQFEALFTTGQFDDQEQARKVQQQFLDTLLELPHRHPRWKIILVIQTEFIEQCRSYENLNKILQNPIQVDAIRPMTHEEERTAIEEQVMSVDMIMDGGLSHQILLDLDGKLGRMGRIQHILRQLWQYRRGRHLQLSAYEKFLDDIIDNAEKHYRQYSDNSLMRTCLRNIYLRLVDFHGNGMPRMRERVPIAEFYPSLVNKGEIPKASIDQLIDEITNTQRHIAFLQKSEVEITYDRLISNWPRLQGWLETTSLNQYRQEIAEASRKWINNHEDEWYLQHRGTTLEKIKEYKKNGLLLTTEDEDKYLESCAQKEKQYSKFRRFFGWFFPAILFIAAVILSISSLLLCIPSQETTSQQGEAHPVSKDISQ